MNAVRGWCPGAWRPMRAGDGLLVRVRPPLGRLTVTQVLGLCEEAIAHGSGQIDVTSRAGLQIRGVADAGWPALVAALVALGLVDADPVRETRGAILVAPEWRAGDDTHRIANALAARSGELPELPDKFGFAIDAGSAPVLGDTPADLRIERDRNGGGLLLRADGRATGIGLPPHREADALIALARWFIESGGGVSGRMARHAHPLPDWAGGDRRPAPAAIRTIPGSHALGTAYGLAFGRLDARTLYDLIRAGPATAMRITPWRVIILEGDTPRDAPGLLGDPDAPALRVDACPGAPACPQATVETRDLARRIAPFVAGRLHVSGCAKGCARGRSAAVVLTGRGGAFDLAFYARAGDPPVHAALSPADVAAYFGAA